MRTWASACTPHVHGYRVRAATDVVARSQPGYSAAVARLVVRPTHPWGRQATVGESPTGPVQLGTHTAQCTKRHTLAPLLPHGTDTTGCRRPRTALHRSGRRGALRGPRLQLRDQFEPRARMLEQRARVGDPCYGRDAVQVARAAMAHTNIKLVSAQVRQSGASPYTFAQWRIMWHSGVSWLHAYAVRH
jgi:hypothetical protein